MGFELSDGSRKYFKQIQERSNSGKFKIQFDFYYLCCILGMLKNKFPKQDSTNEIARQFPGDYYNQKDHIIGLLIDAEIRRTGLVSSDRKSLEKFVLKLVSMDNPNHLSEEGEKYLNRYAEGGYQFIISQIGTVDEYTSFMIEYYELIGEKK